MSISGVGVSGVTGTPVEFPRRVVAPLISLSLAIDLLRLPLERLVIGYFFAQLTARQLRRAVRVLETRSDKLNRLGISNLIKTQNN